MLGAIAVAVKVPVSFPVLQLLYNKRQHQKITHGKTLDGINPVPIAAAVASVRKRSRQLAAVLTSDENNKNKRKVQEGKMK